MLKLYGVAVLASRPVRDVCGRYAPSVSNATNAFSDGVIENALFVFAMSLVMHCHNASGNAAGMAGTKMSVAATVAHLYVLGSAL